jgi:hypothetical protein
MRFESPPPEPLASATGFLLSWNGQRTAHGFAPDRAQSATTAATSSDWRPDSFLAARHESSRVHPSSEHLLALVGLSRSLTSAS